MKKSIHGQKSAFYVLTYQKQEMLKVKNHQGAVKFTKEIEKYLIKELKRGQ
jgi:hypothetical protein